MRNATLCSHALQSYFSILGRQVSQLIMAFIKFLFVFIFINNVIKILIIFILIFFGISFSFLSLFLILLILHLLSILGNSPKILSSLLGLCWVISDHDVVKDGSRLDLPEIETKFAKLVEFSKSGSLFLVIFGIVNFRVDPWSLVVRVVNLSGFPLTLVFRVVNHGWFPFTVHLIIPVLWFGSIRISNVLWLLPIFRLDILRVINLGGINPVVGLADLGILDLLRWEEVPVIGEGTLLCTFVVNEDFISSIWVDN